jgi:hypothetical protein
MKKEQSYKIALEVISWLITFVIVAAALAPIYLYGIDYPFWIGNAALIIIFITGFRYTFLLKFSWLQSFFWIKVGFIAFGLLLVVSLANYLSTLNRYMDEDGLNTITYALQYRDQLSMIRYIKSQILFFGVGSIVASLSLAIRLAISVWRDVNRS